MPKQTKPLGKLVFKLKDVMLLVNHSLSSKKFLETLGEAYIGLERKTQEEIDNTVKAGLHLVKDRGAYLMSNGKPDLMRWQVDKQFKNSLKVVCKEYQKKLLLDNQYWRDKLPDYVEANQTKDPVEFAARFGGEKEIPFLKYRYVIYAKGFNPNEVAFEDWYDKLHKICGGDDFVELLDYNMIQIIKKADAHKLWKTLIITMYKDSFQIDFN